jgi:sensor histidine kinase YesM
VFGILVYLIILLINNDVKAIGTLVSNQEVYVTIALSLISFESMRLTLIIIKRFSSSALTQNPLQVVITTSISVAIVLIAISIYYQLVIGFAISQRELWLFGVIFTLTSLLYNALYIGNEYLHLENTLRIEQERKLQESLESEFLAFRQDINPDLLYDSLEELILCVHSKTDMAEELIDSLAALYRYQLIHRQKEFIHLTEEIQATQHLIRLANQKHGQTIRWNNKINERLIEIIPGALIAAVDSIIRNTLISVDSPLILTLEQEDEEYFVLHHNVNDKLQPHPESIQTFQRLQRSYSVYSDSPFVQVKASRENYIKFPIVKVDQAITKPA